MEKSMRKLVLLCLLIVISFSSHGVNAQGDLSFEFLEVAIWPEFDRPEILVIYRGRLSGNVTLPVSLSIRIPVEAGDPNAVAVQGDDGRLLNATFTRIVEGEWSTITFITDSPVIQLEYYDPSLYIEGSARHFEYTWSGDYAISDFRVQVQHPVDAGEVRISPNLGEGRIGDYGLNYYQADLGALSAGESRQINLDYEKSSNSLSANSIPSSSSLDPVLPSSPQEEGINPLIVIGVVLGIALISVGGYSLWQTSRTPLKSKAGKGKKTRTRGKRKSLMEKSRYCGNCGEPARADANFCRKCGTKI
jgi:hypothetical protein